MGVDPDPANISHLTVAPVAFQGADWEGEGTRSGAPFVYDRGTKTIHLGPEGESHPNVIHLTRGKLQGPVYNGYIEGGGVGWYSSPERGEREAIAKLLARHTGQPLVNYHDTNEPEEFRVGYSRPLQCSTCGDELEDGVNCRRCNWGGWNIMEDSLGPISDPTTPLKGDFVAVSAVDEWEEMPYWNRPHQEWSPGLEGKGFLGENGVYTWRIDPRRYPRHMDMRRKAEQQVGQISRGFHIAPDGMVYDYMGNWPVTKDVQAISQFDPRLHNRQDDPNQFTLGFTRTIPEDRWFWQSSTVDAPGSTYERAQARST